MKRRRVSIPEGVARQRWRWRRKASVLVGRARRAAFRAGARLLFAFLLFVVEDGFFSDEEASGAEGIGSPVGRSMGFSAVEVGSAISFFLAVTFILFLVVVWRREGLSRRVFGGGKAKEGKPAKLG